MYSCIDDIKDINNIDVQKIRDCLAPIYRNTKITINDEVEKLLKKLEDLQNQQDYKPKQEHQ